MLVFEKCGLGVYESQEVFTCRVLSSMKRAKG